MGVWSGVEEGMRIEVFDGEERGGEEMYGGVEGSDVVGGGVGVGRLVEDGGIDGVGLEGEVDGKDGRCMMIRVNGVG